MELSRWGPQRFKRFCSARQCSGGGLSSCTRHFLNRKGIAQNVLGQLGQEAFVFRPYGFATVYVEPCVFPRIEQFDAVCFEKIQFDQKLNDTGTEDFLQWFEGQLRQGMKNAIAGKHAVSNQGVDVGMKVQVLAKGMEGQDNCWVRFLIFQSSAQVNGKAFVSGCAGRARSSVCPLRCPLRSLWMGGCGEKCSRSRVEENLRTGKYRPIHNGNQ